MAGTFSWFVFTETVKHPVTCYSAWTVTLNNASDYQANGLLSGYIGWTNGLTDYRANALTD